MNTELVVEDHFEKFLRLSAANGDARPRTIKAYKEAIRYYATWAGTVTLNPAEAGHENILAYRSYLIAAGYARSTIRLRLTAVRLFYRALSRWGSRRDNPAEGVRAPRAQEGASSAVLSRAVSPEKAKVIIAGAGNDRDGAMVRLMLLHGLRAGEVSRLTDKDLSPDGDRLRVPGKGGKIRTLILSYRCRADLAAPKPGYLFQRRGGGSLSVRSIERAVNKQLELAGAKEPGKSCHSLRHACAIAAVMGGARPEAISEMLGHSDPKTTFIYTRAASQHVEKASDAVERSLK